MTIIFPYYPYKPALNVILYLEWHQDLVQEESYCGKKKSSNKEFLSALKSWFFCLARILTVVSSDTLLFKFCFYWTYAPNSIVTGECVLLCPLNMLTFTYINYISRCSKNARIFSNILINNLLFLSALGRQSFHLEELFLPGIIKISLTFLFSFLSRVLINDYWPAPGVRPRVIKIVTPSRDDYKT